MARLKYVNFAVDASGNTLSGAQVEVRDTAGSLVTLYEASTGSTQAYSGSNPFSAGTGTPDKVGYFEFWVEEPLDALITVGTGASAVEYPVYFGDDSLTINPATFSGDGSTVDFVLPFSAAAPNGVNIFIDGIHQAASTYSVGSATITFSEAPPVGTDNIEVRYSVVESAFVIPEIAVAEEFETVSALLATTKGYADFTVGSYLRVVDGNYVYKVAASGATDQDLTTTGGGSLKLYVQEDAQGVRNLKAFGAVNDGSDMSAVLQAAIDRGGSIAVDEKYTVSSAVSFASSAATPKTLHLFGRTAESELNFTSGADFTLTKSNYSSDVSIKNMIVSSDGSAGTQVFFNVARGEVENVYFSGFPNAALLVNQAYQEIEHCVFVGCGAGIKCVDNTSDPTAYYNANTIAYCFFASCDTGIDLRNSVAAGGVGSARLLNITIIQPVFEFCTNFGIQFAHANNPSVLNPYFEGTPVNIEATNFTLGLYVLNPYSHPGETTFDFDDSKGYVTGGKLRDIDLANGSLLQAIGPTHGTVGTITTDATSYYKRGFDDFPTPWTTLTPAGSWSNFGSGFQDARYYRDESDVVHVQGTLTGGASGSQMLGLPSADAPAANLTFTGRNVSTGTSATIRVASTGAITHIAGTTTSVGFAFSYKI